MTKVEVFLMFCNEARFCKLEEGISKGEILSYFHSLFETRSGDILQYQELSLNSPIWVNCDDDYQLSSSTKSLRVIKSAEKMMKLGNLQTSSSVVFCCDMQERFKPAIKYFDEIVTVASRVLKAANILKIPIVVTEQYPKGLGKTVSELCIGQESIVAEKTKFSMIVPDVESYMKKNLHISSVIIFGVEAHVCVQQTVLDLLKQGYEVHVIADATSSRNLVDRHLAYERLRHAGAYITTCETVLLQWVADKQHEQFKPIQNLIKELPPDTGLQIKSSI